MKEAIKLMNIQRQHEENAKLYESAALEVMKCGGYIGGEHVKKFEEEFAEYCGSSYGVSCGSGTDAIVLALRALNIGHGDEVITSAFTFFATAEGIAAVGAMPVFVDVDEKSFCINPKLIEKKITAKTRAIIPVHIYGQCADMDSINKIAKKHKLSVIEDCAQAAGSKYNGRPAGSLGDIGCFSFFPTKNLGADGDGGMVVTNRIELYRACKSLRVHGSGEDGLFTLQREYNSKGKDFPKNIPIGKDKYHNYLIGYNSRLDAIQAAILRKKLPLLDSFVKRRQAHAHAYDKWLCNTSYETPFVFENCFHSYYIYALRHKNAEVIMNKLREDNIPCGTYYPIPLHLQGAFANLGYKAGDLPITEMLCKETFAVPVYPELYSAEQQQIIDALLNAEKS